MFYGRMDIYWPDGPVESYRLEKPTVAIGRSTGNDIVLDTTAVSRYHTTITLKNQQAMLEDLDSVNGTYVDGVRLNANDPHVLRGGEEIQIGDVRLIFHPASEETLAASDTTQRVTVTQPTYRVDLEGPDMAVAPGAHVLATLRIENLGDETDRYFVEIDGLPKGWARVDQVELEVDPTEQNQAVISLKPLRRSETRPGDHPFTVQVRSRSKPAQTVDVPAVLHVLPYGGFGMALGATRFQNGDGFKLYVHNQGNAPLPITVNGVDQDRALRFHLPVSHITLAPGERQTLTGAIGPRRRRMFGQPHEHEFALVAQSHDAAGFAASVPGTFVEAGLLPGWVPVLAIPAVALLALLLVGFLLLVVARGDESEPPAVQPVINQFTVTNSALTLGDVTEIVWDVADTEMVDLIVARGSDERRVPMTAESMPFRLTFDQTGLYNLTLYAVNGDLEATTSAAVQVRPAVTLSLQTAGELTLIRNVEQPVTLNWTVDGAQALEDGFDIRFESSDPAIQLPAAPLAQSGTETLTIAPQSDAAEWLVTLSAAGQDGVVASVTQKLPIIYPSCELDVPRTLVRRGPGEVYPAVAPSLERPADGALPLSPLARDPSGEWLMVTIGVDANARTGWVLADDFACTGFDPEQLIVTEDYPPPPELTATPTVTAGPTTQEAASPEPAPTTTPPTRPAAIPSSSPAAS